MTKPSDSVGPSLHIVVEDVVCIVVIVVVVWVEIVGTAAVVV